MSSGRSEGPKGPGRRPFAIWAEGRSRCEYLGSAVGTCLEDACRVLSVASPWFQEGFRSADLTWRGKQIIEGPVSEWPTNKESKEP